MAKCGPPDKFRVGQRCAFAMDIASGWLPFDGEPCTVIAKKQRVNVECSDWDGGNRNIKRSARYLVRWSGGELYVRERNLRRLDDGNRLSTWEQFAKVTGIRIDKCDPAAEEDRRVALARQILWGGKFEYSESQMAGLRRLLDH